MRFAVVLHLYYEDQWPEFSAALESINDTFGLFVSLGPHSDFEGEIRRTFPDAVVSCVPNVGRDVAPFLAWLPNLQKFDAVCKIHTKRNDAGHIGWRRSLVNGLLGSAATVRVYVDAFEQEPDLVLAGPSMNYVDGDAHIYHSRRALTLQHGELPAGWGFFAGTMFWCRPSFFISLKDDYPQDVFVAHGDSEGHPEHVIERAFGLMARCADKKIMLGGEHPTIARASQLRGNLDWSERYLGFKADPAEETSVAQAEGVAPSLVQLYEQQSGHPSEKWSGSLKQYERICRGVRDRKVKLLEIGVRNGGSLEVWSRYFPSGRFFVGCDIDPKCAEIRFDDDRIKVVTADAAAPFAKTLIMSICGQFDIIIDDGSHRADEIMRAFLQFFPALAEGGVYIVDGVNLAEFSAEEGGPMQPTSSLAFFRTIADVLARSTSSDPTDAAHRLAPFVRDHDLEIDVALFRTILSIEFAGSLVVLRKAAAHEIGPGTRMRRGSASADWDAETLQSLGQDSTAFPSPSPAVLLPAAIFVSAVVCFKNGSANLPDAILSIQKQSRPVYEIIVIDDGSVAHEAEWLQYFAKDAGFKLLRQDAAGSSAARNFGIRAASGTHVCFVDQDDILLPQHGEAFVDHWRSISSRLDRLGWIFSDYRLIDENQTVTSSAVLPHSADPIPATLDAMLGRELHMASANTFIDRAAFLSVGGFDERLCGFEFDDLFLRLFIHGYGTDFFPHALADRRNLGGLASQGASVLDSTEAFFVKWLGHRFDNPEEQKLCRTNLKARILRSLQARLGQGLVDDDEAFWSLFEKLEAAN